MTKEQIGQTIKESRISAELTQSQVAKKLGRPQQTIASWESGKSQPDANTLFELFQVLGRSVDEAFGFTGGTPPLSGEALKVARDYDNLPMWQKRRIREEIERYMASDRYLFDNLKRFREKKNLTPEALSDKTGIPLARIQKFEDERGQLHADELIRSQEALQIAAVLEISPRSLLGLNPTYEQMQHVLTQGEGAEPKDQE